jgi:hypothetical protein
MAVHISTVTNLGSAVLLLSSLDPYPDADVSSHMGFIYDNKMRQILIRR